MESKKTGEILFFKISVFLLFLICFIPLCYLAGIIIPIPYGALMTLTTLLYIIISWRYENIFSKKYISKISAGTIISIFIILAIVFIISIILLDSYRDFAFKIAIMLISITCACISAVYGGAIKNEPLLVEPPNTFLQVFTVLLKRIPFKIFITIATFVFSAIVWIILSYGSYYSGVEVGAKQAANIAVNKISEVIKRDIENPDKKKEIDQFLQKVNTKAQIVVNKNNEMFTESYPESAVRPGYELSGNLLQKEPGSDDEKAILNKLKDKDHNQYLVSYKFPNKPFLIGGLGRAIFFSMFSTDNEKYFKSQFYLRSMHLWWVFWLLYALSLFGYYLYQGKEEEYNKRINEYEEKMRVTTALNIMQDNTAEIYQLMAAEMQQEMRDITTSKAKNTLQKMISNWNDKMKTDYIRNKYEKVLISAEKAAHDTNHILKNKWPANELYEKYPDDIKPYVNEILEDLKAIPNVISVKMEDFSIKQITDSILEMYKKYRKDPQVKFSCDIITDESINTMLCYTNLHRINSIVFNLLSNSVKITNKFRKRYRDEHEDDEDFKEYFRKVALYVGVTDYDNKPYLSIRVKDNGGGFNDEIIGKVYREPIKSEFRTKESKNQNRMGEGTVYIGFFVGMMNGKILAENYIDNDGFKGASTEVLLPIKDIKLQEVSE